MSIDIRRKSVFVGHKGRLQKQTAGETVNLAARTKVKKRQWKVTINPEINDDDEEEALKKNIGYMKPLFDSDKIYQAIEGVVDKALSKGSDDSYVYNVSENVNLCQRISKEIRDTLKTWRQLMR